MFAIGKLPEFVTRANRFLERSPEAQTASELGMQQYLFLNGQVDGLGWADSAREEWWGFRRTRWKVWIAAPRTPAECVHTQPGNHPTRRMGRRPVGWAAEVAASPPEFKSWLGHVVLAEFLL